MRKKLLVRIGTIVFSGAVIIVGFGQGCGKFTAKSDSEEINGQDLASTNSDDPTIMPNTETLGLVYGKQIFDQYNTCIGSGIPTDRTIAMYSSKQGTVSETGQITTLTAPMLMAAASIAGEVCEDLILQEKMGQRIFVGFDFNSSNLPNDGLLEDAVRRISRSCWSRDEDPEEADLIINNLKAAFTSSSTNASHDAALFMCTSMLGALDGIVL